jgi:TolB-like protein/Tfp pilus assembly protein PilF
MTEKSGRIYRFWNELKRRRVLRMLAIYAGTAFVILEAATIIFPRFGLPDWAIDVLLYMLIAGLLITIIIAWIFDITPDGVRKTLPVEEAGDSERPAESKVWKAATYISLVVITALIILNAVPKKDIIKSGDIESLVVLPFDNFTGDDQLEYFVSGMHASLIGDMGQIGGMRVISKTSSNSYKGADKSIPEIATELGVDAVVESQVMCVGDTICLQIRVVTPFPEEKQLWSADYREEKSQILNLYNRVTKQIASEVRIELSPDEERVLNKDRTVDKEAYDHYLMGLFYWDKLSRESLDKALEYFDRAVAIDPDWAPPYAGIAQVWVGMAQMGHASPEISGPIIMENLSKALELDPAHYTLGLIATWVQWNYELGEQELRKALDLNPNDALSRIYYAHLLTCLLREDEALAQAEQAVALDPLNPLILGLNAVVIASAGQKDYALVNLEKAISIDPYSFFAHHVMEFVAYDVGDKQNFMKAIRFVFPLEEEVFQLIERIAAEDGLQSAYKELVAHLEVLQQSTFMIPVHMANRYTRIGSYDKVLDQLELGFQLHDQNMTYIRTGFNKFNPVYEDLRFLSLVEKMQLPLP